MHLAYSCDLVIFILRCTVGLLHAMNLHIPGRDARPVQSGELFSQSCPVHYPFRCLFLHVVVRSGFGYGCGRLTDCTERREVCRPQRLPPPMTVFDT